MTKRLTEVGDLLGRRSMTRDPERPWWAVLAAVLVASGIALWCGMGT